MRGLAGPFATGLGTGAGLRVAFARVQGSPRPSRRLVAGGAAAALALAAVALLAGRELGSDRAARDNATRQVADAVAEARLLQPRPASPPRLDYAALDRRFARMAERPVMVGLAVGIVEDGEIRFLKGYGETAEGSGEAVTPSTVFRWASVSKGVAATAVVRLAEQGRIDLNRPVAAYAPSLRLPGGNERVATVGDVLSHRLGLYRNAYDNKLEEGQDAFVLRGSLAALNSICRPGTCWSYQNVAYDSASEMVSRVTGLSFGDALRRDLFDPLGMTSASVTMEGLTGSASWARPHSVGRRPLELNDNYYRVPAAGGVNSDIKDMTLWMIAQMGGRTDVLSPGLLDTLHAPLVKTPGERARLRKFAERLRDPTYGYGWRSYDYAGHRIVGHRGGVNGYRSLILFDPALKSGVVALWNSNTSQPGGLEFEVMDMLYGLAPRDWMELDRGGARAATDEAGAGEPR